MAKKLKSKYVRKAKEKATKRLQRANIISNRTGKFEDYKPKRLNANYGKAYGDFRKEAESRVGEKSFAKDGRFTGGTLSKYRDRSGKLQGIRKGAQTVSSRGKVRSMGTVQGEANKRYKRSSAFVRSSKLKNLKKKIQRRDY